MRGWCGPPMMDDPAHKGHGLGGQVGGREEGQGDGDDGAHNGTQKGDADGFQQQIGHTLGGEVEQQVPCPGGESPPGCSRRSPRRFGGARRFHGGAAPDQ